MKASRDRHIEVVCELVKPAKQVFEEMTEQKVAVTHAIFGVIGEVLEFKQAVIGEDRENIIEEAGDLSFYLIDLRRALGLPIIHDVRYNFRIGELFTIMETSAEFILDKCKKFIIYNKPLTSSITEIADEVDAIEQCLNSILRDNVLTREDALLHNIHKLKEGPKARYKDGYSDKSAQARVDKI